ncbi:antizyme inhibitor 1-like [Physeter macrocephalus]|uniref:Antizyme inhibitor 1 n=1 Tax=Physeter macrocephalus TaxID=9755 RepID=A0A2Y9T3N6_PHYMC|nr:antizyme inhibitor 1-like [Physeter catodon]|eukprot:XP_023984172.2 antizyme inhibitor 1-like [Physeter catodon]
MDLKPGDRLRCFVSSPSLPLLILSRSLLCGVTRLNPLRTQPSPFFFCPRCSISLLRPPPPLLHSWCRCRAFPPASSPQPMAQAALGISAQGPRRKAWWPVSALVQELCVSPENIIYISPCKQVSQIKYAAKVGVNIMTCDNEVELKKIARNHPNAKVLLHIATEDNIGGEEGNMKFGTTLKNCRHLLECAKELDVQIIGVKFHVSSACKESQVYVHALSDARCVFDMAGEFGFTMNMLDIGGGLTGTEFQLEEVNHVISPLLDVYFPEGSGIKIISEPGSYYVSSAFTLAVNIIAKKVVENKFSSGVGKTGSDEPTFMYYMNDGVYGSFASKLSEDLNTIPEVHKKYKEDEPLFTSSLWGPSCDELDQIVENCLLPELNVGDWLIFDNMGADSFHEPSAFNDFQRVHVHRKA